MLEEFNSLCCVILVTQVRVRIDKKDLKFLLEGAARSEAVLDAKKFLFGLNFIKFDNEIM